MAHPPLPRPVESRRDRQPARCRRERPAAVDNQRLGGADEGRLDMCVRIPLGMGEIVIDGDQLVQERVDITLNRRVGAFVDGYAGGGMEHEQVADPAAETLAFFSTSLTSLVMASTSSVRALLLTSICLIIRPSDARSSQSKLVENLPRNPAEQMLPFPCMQFLLFDRQHLSRSFRGSTPRAFIPCSILIYQPGKYK